MLRNVPCQHFITYNITQLLQVYLTQLNGCIWNHPLDWFSCHPCNDDWSMPTSTIPLVSFSILPPHTWSNLLALLNLNKCNFSVTILYILRFSKVHGILFGLCSITPWLLLCFSDFRFYSNTLGHSGMFHAITTVIDHCKTEWLVDVFQVV